MGLSTAERNRRKRERKKKEKEQRRKEEEALKDESLPNGGRDGNEVEIEYVAEAPLAADDGSDAFEAVRRFQERVASIVTDDEKQHQEQDAEELEFEDDDEEGDGGVSKRKLRDMLRPSVAELKRRVQRPDLVEAHDVTATDPDFLIRMKSVPGTVPVPRHWGRKRKYLQGKVRSCSSLEGKCCSTFCRRLTRLVSIRSEDLRSLLFSFPISF